MGRRYGNERERTDNAYNLAWYDELRADGKWHVYGDEYKTVYQCRNIKFVKAKEGSATALMETRTAGRPDICDS